MVVVVETWRANGDGVAISGGDGNAFERSLAMTLGQNPGAFLFWKFSLLFVFIRGSNTLGEWSILQIQAPTMAVLFPTIPDVCTRMVNPSGIDRALFEPQDLQGTLESIATDI